MPAFALVAWRFLRPFLPYILSALAVIALLYGAYSWSYNRGAHSRDAEVAAEQARAEGFKANQEKLTDALNSQNAAIDAMRTEGVKRVSDGKAALKQANKTDKPLADQAEALRRSAGRKVGVNDPCVISNVLGNLGGV